MTREEAYNDENAVSLITLLPHWTVAALVNRCAKRLLPVYENDRFEGLEGVGFVKH